MAVQYYCHMSPSVSRDQYTALSLKGFLVMLYGHMSYIYTFCYNFDTVLCQLLETGTSDRCLIYIVQLLRFSGFSLYPLSFFPYSPFKYIQTSMSIANHNLTNYLKENKINLVHIIFVQEIVQ